MTTLIIYTSYTYISISRLYTRRGSCQEQFDQEWRGVASTPAQESVRRPHVCHDLEWLVGDPTIVYTMSEHIDYLQRKVLGEGGCAFAQ